MEGPANNREDRRSLYFYLAFPTLIWLFIFLLGPLLLVAVVAFLQKGTYGGISWEFDFTHWHRVFNASYLKIVGISFWQAVLTSTLTTVAGFIAAWVCSSLNGNLQSFFVGLIALPSFLNLIVRIYAIKIFAGVDGPLQGALSLLGISFDPFLFSSSTGIVLWGMFSTYLPFAFLPIFAAFEKFDFTLVEAARDLGAQTRHLVFRILIPNLKGSLFGAFMLVFIPSFGEFIIPDLIGGARQMYLGNLISEQVLRARDWPMGSSLAVLLILALILLYNPKGDGSKIDRKLL